MKAAVPESTTLRTVSECEMRPFMWKWSFIVMAGLASIAEGSPPKPIDAPLCAITRSPMAYNGKIVRFRAAVLTDWHHGIQLFVEGCRGGIQLASTDHAPAVEGHALDAAIGTPLNGGYDRTAVATFTGRIMWRRRTRQAPFFYNPLAVDAYRISSIETGHVIKPR